MGDWNTLHHFDDKKFYAKVIPDLKGEGRLLRRYFNSDFGKQIVYGDDRNDKRVEGILKLSQFLDADYKSHKTLFDIQRRKKSPDEKYADFIRKRNRDEADFQKANALAIEDVNRILTLIIFSECAAFNPHLILGKRIFTSCVSAKPKSVSEEIIQDITDNASGSIFYSSGANCSGIINWVTHEDLQLLWLDKEHLYPADKDSERYFSDFLKFIEIAIENGLGVVSGTNMNEGILKRIPSPLGLEIDIQQLGLKSVINYD